MIAYVILLNKICEWMMDRLQSQQESKLLLEHSGCTSYLLVRFLLRSNFARTNIDYLFENMEHNFKVSWTHFRTKVFKRETSTFLLKRKTAVDTKDTLNDTK